MDMEVKGCRELFEEVVDAGLCAYCGACASGCPYLVSYKGRIVLLDNCDISEGQCYQYCPRTHTDLDTISQQVFGADYSADELGTVKEVLIARSTDLHIRERAQYGGVVTTLMSLALEEGYIESAILAKMSNDKIPSAFLARNKEGILQCAGSNYMACFTLDALNRIAKDSKDRLGIVAMPCQVLSIRKMKENPPLNRMNIENVSLVLGLFCTWALCHDTFQRFLRENFDLTQVVKFDIPPPPANKFDVYSNSGKISLPLDTIREFIMPTCSYCLDMTAEFADISVGSVEGIEGWNTVLIRTDVGVELMERAKAKKKLEIGQLPSQDLAHLKEAALLKKKRALKEIIKKTGDKKKLLYLGMSESVVDRLLGERSKLKKV
jgi:coenzyme F420 hydrogenase subunit beta